MYKHPISGLSVMDTYIHVHMLVLGHSSITLQKKSLPFRHLTRELLQKVGEGGSQEKFWTFEIEASEYHKKFQGPSSTNDWVMAI